MFPVFLLTAVVLVLFAQYSVTLVNHTLSSMEKVRLEGLAKALSWDSRVFLSLETGDPDRARLAVDELFDLDLTVYRVQIRTRTAGGKGMRLFLDQQRDLAGFPGLEEGGSPFEDPERFQVVQVPLGADPVVLGEGGMGFLEREGRNPPQPARQEIPDGMLTVWADHGPVVRALSQFTDSILTVGGVLLLVMVLVILWLMSGPLRRLEHLDEAAAQLGLGRDDTRVDVDGNDEIGRLAATFNEMAGQLARSRQKIERQNRTLENKVQERTSELRRAYEELKTLDQAKDGFLSSVSHEMRTPLTSIRSFAEILLEYGEEEDPELRKEFLGIIVKESDRLSRLINEILDMAKIEAGKMSWKLEWFDFRDLVMEVVRSLNGLCREKAVLFSVDLPNEEVRYYGDRDRLHQVLTNLLTNAWKFSPEGEEVRSELKAVEGGLLFRVLDRGPGIGDERFRMRIFDRFQQGGMTLTDKPKGTGLGLPISKEIITMHGGLVDCRNRKNGGAVFFVLLPHASPEVSRPVDEAAKIFEVGDSSEGEAEALPEENLRSTWSLPAIPVATAESGSEEAGP